MDKYTGPNHYVHDYETLPNCFLAVFEHYKTDDTFVFTVGLLRNDLKNFLTLYNRAMGYGTQIIRQ